MGESGPGTSNNPGLVTEEIVKVLTAVNHQYIRSCQRHQFLNIDLYDSCTLQHEKVEFLAVPLNNLNQPRIFFHYVPHVQGNRI